MIFTAIIILFIVFLLAPYYKTSTMSTITKESIKEKLELSNSVNNVSGYLITDGPEALLARIALIEHAQESIDICYYRIASSNKSAKVFIGALIDAAKRGVLISIIVDAKMGGIDKYTLSVLSQIENITVYFYNPISIINPQANLVTLHNKYINVDGNIIISGGRNISDTFFNNFDASSVSCDLDMLLIDEQGTSEVFADFNTLNQNLLNPTYTKKMHQKANTKTQRLTEIMNEAYGMYHKEHLSKYSELKEKLATQLKPLDNIVLINSATTPDVKEPSVAYALYHLADTTPNKLIIHSPYATTDKQIIDALSTLTQKKEVRLVTNSITSSPNLPAFSNYWFGRKQLKNTGIRIFEFQGNGMTSIHTKAYLFGDDLVAIGTMNLDNRSLYINTESMMIIKSKAIADALLKISQQIVLNAVEIPQSSTTYYHDHERNAPFGKRVRMRLLGPFFRLFQRII